MASSAAAPASGRPGRQHGRIAVVVPVLDDWPSFTRLIREIDGSADSTLPQIEIVAVDDGSAASLLPDDIELPAASRVRQVRIIRLALNLGHQRAIATGLVTLADRTDLDAVVVMDSDGEDRPADIPALLAAARAETGHVVLAHRQERSESALFKAGYAAYKALFRLLTGRAISFGNFSVLPMAAVRRLVRMPELWNNLPAAIIRSRLRYTTVPTRRGRRYCGESRMNFPALVAHGLSAMSVYTDIVFVRVLLAASAVSAVSMLAMLGVAMIRMFTALAIPGWATVVCGDLLIILFQAMILVVASSLMVLASRSTRPVIPLTDAAVFIDQIVEAEAPAAVAALAAE